MGATGREAHFAPDLVEGLAWGDARYRELMDSFRGYATAQGMQPPEVAEPEPFDPGAPERFDLAGFGAVIFAGRPNYRAWLPWPHAFDDLGFPLQQDGVSAAIPGLYCVHYMRRRKSAVLAGVGEDAAIVAGRIAERLGFPAA